MINFYKDKRFYIPILFFVFLEVVFQLGFYTLFLKKNSYAANVSRITNHVLEKQKEFDPNVLIVGTSVAYQGLSVNYLNSALSEKGYKVQSIAIPGSELIVQELALEKVLQKFKNVKMVVHVVEVTMPWVQQKTLSLPTLAMTSEFNRFQAVKKLYDFQYDVKIDDLSYTLVRSFAYRRDLREFLLAPNERLKHLIRSLRKPNLKIADHENTQKEKVSSYLMSNLDECINKTDVVSNKDPIPNGSNFFHKKAVWDTCYLAKNTTTETKKTESTDLYFYRLSILYKLLKEKNIKVINVFAPYSSLISVLGGNERMQLWEQELKKINGQDHIIVDMQNILEASKNGDYCYDLIHLNYFGMIEFSKALSEFLKTVDIQ
jgi:hypothetical protein